MCQQRTSLTKPPAAVMRFLSVGDAGLWSSDSATAVLPRPSTALESPALATYSSRPWSTATTAVQPTCQPQITVGQLHTARELGTGCRPTLHSICSFQAVAVQVVSLSFTVGQYLAALFIVGVVRSSPV